MKGRNVFATGAALAIAITGMMNPLTVSAQPEEPETEEILEENMDGETLAEEDTLNDSGLNLDVTEVDKVETAAEDKEASSNFIFKGHHGEISVPGSAKIPESLTADVEEAEPNIEKMLEENGTVGYVAQLRDRQGHQFAPSDYEQNYTITLNIPAEKIEYIGEVYCVALYDHQTPPEYRRAQNIIREDGDKVSFEVATLDGSDFRRETARPIWYGYVVTRAATVGAATNSAPGFGMFAPGLGSLKAGNIKGHYENGYSISMEEVEAELIVYPGTKSKAVAISVLDDDNNEITLNDDAEYSVSLFIPEEFVGHELRLDMADDSASSSQGGSPVYIPLEFEMKDKGQTLVFSPSVLNRTFVISDMDSAKSKINPFDDVKEEDWYYEYVVKANEAGLMTGLNSTHFGPNDKMSRAMVVTVLYRMAGSPNVSDTKIFPDVPTGQWYSKAVKWANEKKVVTGYENGKFGPNDNVTREQLATMICRYQRNVAGKNTSDKASLNKFPDKKNVNNFAKDSVQYCVAKGIITGSHGYLLPVDNATRAECAKMLLVAKNTK